MHINLRLEKKQGMMVFHSEADADKYLELRDALPEGQQVEVYFDVLNGNKTLGQLSKVHKVIRAIAASTGDHFEEIKQQVKRKAGLFYRDHGGAYQFKSFRDCSKDELGLAIQVAEELGDFVGVGVVSP